jgi:hypothetical protein
MNLTHEIQDPIHVFIKFPQVKGWLSKKGKSRQVLI